VSPVFAYTLPANNSIYDFFELVGPQFEGTSNQPWATATGRTSRPPLPGSTS
jgi:hypothetical protein